MKVRKLKVSMGTRPKGYVEQINLKGEWLADAGFTMGDSVILHVLENEIRITKAE